MDGKTAFLHGARYHQNGNLDQAVVFYRQALDLDPGLGDASLYLGLALQQLGRPQEAEAAFRAALEQLPGDVDALNGLGAVSLELGNVDQARLCHLQALRQQPDSAEALSGLGNVALASGETDAAILSFEQSLAVSPDSPDTLSNLGVALKMAGRPKDAIARFEAALRLAPDQSDTLYNMGNAWQSRGDMATAMDCYRAAHRASPQAVAPRWGACFAHLDMLFDSRDEIDAARTAYGAALRELDDALPSDDPALMREAAASVGANQPFYLTYQGGNDRELQERYGKMVHRIMTAAFPQFAAPAFPPRRERRIRVGIATGFMHEHSVWKIPTRGWAKHLDRDRFHVFGYYTGVKTDHCTDEARSLFDKLVHEPNSFETLCRSVLDDELDVLLYPDIGMDPTCAKMAALRLAPVQAVSLGHPMTTGLPTMDYFLSSDLMEPEDGQKAYTEELVRLPGLSVHYEPLRQAPPAFDRAHFGFAEDTVLYFCPQSLYKYLPEYDRLFPLVARQVPGCRFVFLANAQADVLNRRFVERLGRSFADHGLVMDDFVTMLPHQPPDAYHALNCVCDVFLDSIEWSGFNTAMEAVSAKLPPVIFPTGHMRGRHSLAVARMLDLDEIIAGSFDEYVALAVRMGTDPVFLENVRQKVVANSPHLFTDMAPIRGLESFLEDAAKKNRRSP